MPVNHTSMGPPSSGTSIARPPRFPLSFPRQIAWLPSRHHASRSRAATPCLTPSSSPRATGLPPHASSVRPARSGSPSPARAPSPGRQSARASGSAPPDPPTLSGRDVIPPGLSLTNEERPDLPKLVFRVMLVTFLPVCGITDRTTRGAASRAASPPLRYGIPPPDLHRPRRTCVAKAVPFRDSITIVKAPDRCNARRETALRQDLPECPHRTWMPGCDTLSR